MELHPAPSAEKLPIEHSRRPADGFVRPIRRQPVITRLEVVAPDQATERVGTPQITPQGPVRPLSVDEAAHEHTSNGADDRPAVLLRDQQQTAWVEMIPKLPNARPNTVIVARIEHRNFHHDIIALGAFINALVVRDDPAPVALTRLDPLDLEAVALDKRNLDDTEPCTPRENRPGFGMMLANCLSDDIRSLLDRKSVV